MKDQIETRASDDNVRGPHCRKRTDDSAVSKLLAAYEAPPLDPAVREELTSFVAKRKEQLPDSMS